MAHPGRNPAIYTPAREALIRRDWPSPRPSQLIFADFNALPGLQLTMKVVQNYAAGIGVCRSASGKRATQAYTRGYSLGVFTPDRIALILREWPSDRPSQLIFADFHDLPGDPTSLKGMMRHAHGLGLRRPIAARVATLAYLKGRPLPVAQTKPVSMPQGFDRHLIALDRAGIVFDNMPEMQAFAAYVPIMSRPDPLAAERLARHAAQARQAHRDVATPFAWEMLG
jgi:hypothetical protein